MPALLVLASAACVAGNADCPCMDVEAVIRLKATKYNETHFLWDAPLLGGDGHNEVYPYPYTYGSSICNTHDSGLGAQCISNSSSQPGWCTDPWCWVDMEKCTASEFEVRRSEFKPDWGIFYSYHACGASSSEWDAVFDDLSSIDGQQLRIGIPALNMVHFKKQGDAKVVGGDSTALQYYLDDAKLFHGPMPEFFQSLVRWSRTESQGVEGYSLTHSSGFSRAQVTSKWTAVVMDVHKGLLDCGLSDFWITTERMQMAQFTVPFFTDLMYLWVKGPEPDMDPWSTLIMVFEPFSPELWILIVCLILAVAILDNWFQRAGWAKEGQPAKEQVSEFARSASLSTFNTSMEFFSGGVDYSGLHGVPSKLLRFGWAFFILIILSAYTANLAAFLASRGVGDYWDTLEKVKIARAKVCAPTALKTELELGFPGVSWVWVPFETEIDAYEKGDCEALVFSKDSIGRDVPMAERFCSAGLVAVELLVDVPVALPCRAMYVKAVSYLMQSMASYGGKPYTSFDKRYQQDVCPIFVEEGEVDELAKLSILNMGGALMILGLGALLGIVLDLSRTLVMRKRNGRSPQPQSQNTHRTTETFLRVEEAFDQANATMKEAMMQMQVLKEAMDAKVMESVY